MPNNQKRRDFLKTLSLAGSGILLSKNLSALPIDQYIEAKGVTLGVITYSFRSMPGSIEDILKYCKESGVKALELMGDPAEAYAGSPVGLMPPMSFPPRPAGAPGNPPAGAPGKPPAGAPGNPPPGGPPPEFFKKMEERNQIARGWRETVGMEKFVELRQKFKEAGVSIYAYKPNALNANSTDKEIDYAMNAAKALGAISVTVELPTDPAHSKRLGEFALKHKVYVGYHAHTQATDIAWDVALAQSPYNSMNLDCGHYIAAGGNNTKESLLALIEAKHDRITSMHLKDRKSKDNGGENVVWGSGNTPIVEILQLMKKNKYSFPATIELEYEIPEGSNAVKEVAKCIQYAQNALKG